MGEETGMVSYWRRMYWAEWGRPPEGPGPHDDRGGPAYIPWLETKLDWERRLTRNNLLIFVWGILMGLWLSHCINYILELLT